VPGLTRAMGMFCDYNNTDLLRKKEERFTMIMTPLILIFFVLPWLWWALKQGCGCIMWCCTWEIYVDEDDLLEKEKKTN
jgi:hypothetical protein